MRRATDNAISEYIEREKGRSEEQWWEETYRRLEKVNHVQRPDDIDAQEMFDVVLTLLKKDFGRVAEFHGPKIFTGGTPRARPVYMTAGAGVDLFELWRVICRKRFFGANDALRKLGDFFKQMNTGVMQQPDAHDDRIDGLRSLRVPSLPALVVLFIHNPRRIVVVRLIYPGLKCEGHVPMRFARKRREDNNAATGVFEETI